MSIVSLALWLLAVVLILLLNAFFVATEFALVASRRSKIKEMVEEGHPIAPVVQKLQTDIGTSVSGTQLGITLCSLALGMVGEEAFNVLINLVLRLFVPDAATFELPHGIGVAISFLLLSSLHVVIGEQIPKFLALRIPERLIIMTAPFFRIYSRLAWPLIWTMDRVAEFCLRLMGIPKPEAEHHLVHSAEELEIIFEASSKAGELGDRETDLLKRVLEMRDRTAEQVMVKVDKMDAVPVNASLASVLKLVIRKKHSKIPVYKDNVDNMVGILNTPELLVWWSANLSNKDAAAQFKLEKMLRPVYHVGAEEKATVLLDELRKRKIQIAVVKNAEKKTVGIVTLEDLLEELVGEIYDEYDH